MKKAISPTSDMAEVSQSRSSTSARYVFWVLAGISCLSFLDRYMFSGAANVIAKEFGFSLDSIGYITSAYTVMYTLTTLPLGMWADRTKRTRVIAVSVAAWSVITVLTALATNFATLFLSRLLLGVGEAGYYPSGGALLSDYFSREKRSRIMSWWSSAQLPGTLIGLALGGILAGLFVGGWRLGFLIAGLPGLFMAWLIWRAREPRRNEADEEAGISGSSRQNVWENRQGAALPSGTSNLLKSLFKIRTLVVLIIVQVCGAFVIGVLGAFLPTYLQQKDAFGMSSGLAGLYAGLIVVGAGVVGILAGGYVADAFSRRYISVRVLVCGIAYLLAIPVFILTMTSHNLLFFTLSFLGTAFFLSVYAGPTAAATQDVVPAALRASGFALSLLIAHLLGDAFSPSIVGFIATAIDPAHAQHFSAGLVGQDLRVAILVCCLPALVIAGLAGLIGTRWMKGDMALADQVNATHSA